MKKGRPSSIVDIFDPEFPFANEFRRLLHRVEKARKGTDLKSFMICSAMLSEGKSTVCSFLGIAAAHKGLKTLIIDCDLRRPSIHKLFRLDREHGVAEILKNGYNPRDAIRKTGIDKLDIITCGSYDSLPSDLFNAEDISNLIQEMKYHYDFILIDTAPALPVSDPMLLASKVDAILLVVKAGSTQKDIALRAVDILDPDRNLILGVVLNNMDSALPYYYDYHYFGYEYVKKPTGRKKSLRSRDKNQGKKNFRKNSGLEQMKTDDAKSRTNS